VSSVFVVRLCADIAREGWIDLTNRELTPHGLDDRAAIRMLMTIRQPGDAILTTHLGLPAIWWYGGVNLSDAPAGASLPDGGPIFEVSQEMSDEVCRSDDLKTALAASNHASIYLGFEPGNRFELLALNRLAELGTITTYHPIATHGYTAVVDL